MRIFLAFIILLMAIGLYESNDNKKNLFYTITINVCLGLMFL